MAAKVTVETDDGMVIEITKNGTWFSGGGHVSSSDTVLIEKIHGFLMIEYLQNEIRKTSENSNNK